MDQLQGDRTRTGWAAAGSILGAIAASSCCILPLLLFSLGAGGAWIANLTALAPYQPIFFAATSRFLGYGFYAVYRKPRRACAGGAAGARTLPNQIVWAASSEERPVRKEGVSTCRTRVSPVH